ncbi:MAG: cyclodeaminase/cyclohydrolase family protein [Atopobiaceae bacterium]|nr:cyclodeaminase/cyclohydrolase family protein [Atopobiaceae bacterium]
MDGKLIQRTCADFAKVLSAKEAVPGGGGVAAYVGALAVALCSMVGNFTTGKKTYALVEGDVRRMLSQAEDVRTRLLELVDEDAAAFVPLSKAYAIPRDEPSRAEVLERATKQACAAPLDMMRLIAKTIELLEEMGQKGSRMLQSDVACGALLAAAALQAASINVYVNTRTLADRVFAQDAEDESDALLAEYVPRAQACADRVIESIRKRG